MREQIYCFLVSLLLGILGGLLYDALVLFRLPFKSKWARYLVDFAFCAVFAGGYLLFSVYMGLPGLRAYMFLSCMLGFLLYRKSFHKTVAFFAEKIYNAYKGRTKRDRRLCRKGLRCRKKKQGGSP